MKNIVKSITIAVPMAFSIAAHGGSNLGWSGYPDHSCSEPFYMNTKPSSFTSQDEVDNWNYQVRDYNSQMETFRTCINRYIKNGSSDIKEIREKQEDAISDWKKRN
jgi:hypothetical protein